MSEEITEQEEQPQYCPHMAPARNDAIRICFETYNLALDVAKKKNLFENRAYQLAREVYLRSMPPLCGRENIQDFIACVAYAMMMKIIEPEESTRLLYAAQVAQSIAKWTRAEEAKI
jgi:hypothetical protein